MLAKWTEILPVFVVRWIALRYCERFDYSYGSSVPFVLVAARPDVMFKVEKIVMQGDKP
jgi:hypothetical protein